MGNRIIASKVPDRRKLREKQWIEVFGESDTSELAEEPICSRTYALEFGKVQTAVTTPTTGREKTRK